MMHHFPTLERLFVWWRALSHRERVLLRSLGAVVAVVLVLVLVVRPLQAARATALADIRTYETLVARLRLAGANLHPQAPRRSGTPAEVAAASAAGVGLTLQASQADAAGVRVTLAAAPFDATLRWLADLEQTSDLRARSINLSAGASPGLVQGEVVLAQ